MGGVIGVKDPYEYSNSVEVDDFDKKRESSSNNINNTSNNNMTVTLPSSSMQTTPSIDKIQPVRMHVLDVPLIERHPFQEYRFSKKLGE